MDLVGFVHRHWKFRSCVLFHHCGWMCPLESLVENCSSCSSANGEKRLGFGEVFGIRWGSKGTSHDFTGLGRRWETWACMSAFLDLWHPLPHYDEGGRHQLLCRQMPVPCFWNSRSNLEPPEPWSKYTSILYNSELQAFCYGNRH